VEVVDSTLRQLGDRFDPRHVRADARRDRAPESRR